ncbi:MAG: Ig-like domain-containing protein [Tannerellaceae bacterium]|nr:Ig-like domain-containing protein [Tannerellaceae bacterium]
MFFYYEKPGTLSLPDTITLHPGQNKNIFLTYTPADCYMHSVRWASGDTTAVKVDQDGMIYALRPDVTATVTVSGVTANRQIVSAQCVVKVSAFWITPEEFPDPIRSPSGDFTEFAGSEYHLFALDGVSTDRVASRVKYDLRPGTNGGQNRLDIWDNTYTALTVPPEQANSFGYTNQGWIALKRNNPLWSGAAFHVGGMPVDITPIQACPECYYLHLAVMGPEREHWGDPNRSHFTKFNFTWKTTSGDERSFKFAIAPDDLISDQRIGERLTTDGYPIVRLFPANGQWYEMSIPLAQSGTDSPLFHWALPTLGNGQDGDNFFSFSTGIDVLPGSEIVNTGADAELHLDAVYIYRHDPLTFAAPQLNLPAGSVMNTALKLSSYDLSPSGLKLTSSDPSLLRVDNLGRLYAVAPSSTPVRVSCEQLFAVGKMDGLLHDLKSAYEQVTIFDTTFVTVTPSVTPGPLLSQAQSLYPILMDADVVPDTTDFLDPQRFGANLCPDDTTRFLDLWHGSLAPDTAADGRYRPGIFGEHSRALLLTKDSADWAGMALRLAPSVLESDGPVARDLRRIPYSRDKYYFQLALRSYEPGDPSLVTITLSDGHDTVSIPLGKLNKTTAAESITKYDFPRDGQWYTLRIPLSDPIFDVEDEYGNISTLFSRPLTPPAGGLNLFSLTIEGANKVELAVDAVFFFHDGWIIPEGVRLKIPADGLRVGELARVFVQIYPEFLGGELDTANVEGIVWTAQPADRLFVENGYLGAYQPGEGWVAFKCIMDGIHTTDTLRLTVLPARFDLSRAKKGHNYAPLLMDAQTAAPFLSTFKIVDDLRPNDVERIVEIWNASFVARPPEAGETGFFGYTPWLNLKLADGVAEGGGTIKNTVPETHLFSFAANAKDRSEAAFHIGLKSSLPRSSYTFRLHDGRRQTEPFVIGNCPDTAGREPYRNFPHDGQWHAVQIPIADALFDSLFLAAPDGPNIVPANTPYLTFSTSGEGTTMDVDAAFFYNYKALPPVQLTMNRTAWTLLEGQVGQLEVSFMPAASAILPEELIWISSDTTVVSMGKGGLFTAWKAGTATISAYIEEFPTVQASCVVNVEALPYLVTPGYRSLNGTHYRLFLTGQQTLDTLRNGAVRRLDDYWGPDVTGTAGLSALNIWEATMQEAEPLGQTNSYGMYDAWLSLSQTDKGWGGFAFSTGDGVPIDLSEMIQHKEDYVFHVALKTTDEYVSYGFILSDGLHQRRFAIGNAYFEDTILPLRNFRHDGAWHEVTIPLTELLCDGMFETPFAGTEPVDLLAFVTRGYSGQQIEMDALFFYCPPKAPTAVSFAFTDTTLACNEVVSLVPRFEPYAAYVPEADWTWTLTTLPNGRQVAVRHGCLLSARQAGAVDIRMEMPLYGSEPAQTIAATAQVTVEPESEYHSMAGSHYHVVFLDRYNYALLDRRVDNDLRLGAPTIAGQTEWQIWLDEYTSILTLANGQFPGPNSYSLGSAVEVLFLDQQLAPEATWGGAAFHYPQGGAQVDLTDLDKHPEDYFFHLAMKRNRPDAAYRLIFSNGLIERSLVIGNLPWYDVVSPLAPPEMPSRDFPADGQWHEINIPLTHPVFKDFYKNPITVPEGGWNLVGFVTVPSEGQPITELCIDAVFFYSPHRSVDHFSLPEGGLSLKAGEVLKVQTVPEDIFDFLRWKTTDPDIATVTDEGFLTGLKGGTAQLIASYGKEPDNSQQPLEDDYTLVWADEFDAGENLLPDHTRWGYDIGTGENGWGNNEKECYTARRENVSLRNGNLVITARREDDNSLYGEYTSARLRSKQAWKYGKIEVGFLLPAGIGTWPAIWMLPKHNLYGAWPASGEIDIMEHVGIRPMDIFGTLHMAAASGGEGPTQTILIPPSAELNPHKITLLWEEDSIAWFLDDGNAPFLSFKKTPEATFENWPFDTEFYLILNLAVGGQLAGNPAPDIWPKEFLVDYVRVYQKPSLSATESFFADTCPVTVIPVDAIHNLEGTDYTVLSLHQNTMEILPEDLIEDDLRPNAEIFIWDNSFVEGEYNMGDTDSYGNDGTAGIDLRVGNMGWSGGGFLIRDKLIDLTKAVSDDNRDFFAFHMSLRSSDDVSAYTFTFNDGTDATPAVVAVGNTFGEGGLMPKYDFPRDGQWHDVEIPLSLPEFDGLFQTPVPPDEEGLNFFTFAAGGAPWQRLNMDALFFYDRTRVELTLALDRQTLDMQVHRSARLSAKVTPKVRTREVTWQSSNPAVATVTHGGFVSALRNGETEITATLEDKRVTCTVHVTDAEPIGNSRDGSHYYLLYLDDKTRSYIGNRAERDMRPGRDGCSLDNWEEHLDFLPTAGEGMNSYGEEQDWLRMGTKAGETWAGGAFCLQNRAQGIDMSPIARDRAHYSLHLALRSTKPVAAYTFELQNGNGDTVRFVVGNQLDDKGMLPTYDFARDGLWHELDIRLDTSLFDGFFDAPMAVTDTVNLFGFTLGTGGLLEMDAVFFYKRPIPVTGFRIFDEESPSWLYPGDALRLEAGFLPQDAYSATHTVIWRPLNPTMVSITPNGLLKALVVAAEDALPGIVGIEATYAGWKDTCWIEIRARLPFTSRDAGIRYWVISMTGASFDQLADDAEVWDWRPGAVVGNRLDLWEETFTGTDHIGPDSYGDNGSWLSLMVTDKGWSGGAFVVNAVAVADAPPKDLSPLLAEGERDSHFFHIALKSEHTATITLTFAGNAGQTANIAVGPDGQFDFPRDGNWYELDIPLSRPEFNGLYTAPFESEVPLNLLAFSAGEVQGTIIDMDAIFFYKKVVRPMSVSLTLAGDAAPDVLQLDEQQVAVVVAQVTPPDAIFGTLVWNVVNPDVATVNDGIISALSEGTAIVSVNAGKVAASLTVQVAPKTPFTEYYGGRYYLLSLDETTLNDLNERMAVVEDMRPGYAQGYALNVRDNSFSVIERTDGVNSNGLQLPWVRMAVADKGWSEAAFAIGEERDLTDIAQARADYTFHLALKSWQPISAYTFTFTNGANDTAQIVIGNEPNDAGLYPSYDFKRNGSWQELDIPMTLPIFDGLYDAPFGADARRRDVLTFSAGGREGTTLDMDAVFFRRGPLPWQSFDVTPTALEMNEQDVRKIAVQMVPQGSYGEVTWRSLNEEVATVHDGLVSARKAGATEIEVQVGNLIKKVSLTVSPPAERIYPLYGMHYHLLLMDSASTEYVRRNGELAKDWRPDIADNRLDIWGETFEPLPLPPSVARKNSLGQDADWISLVVSDKGWSGGAFVVGGEIDLRETYTEREDWFFHVALKSEQPLSAYTLTFAGADGREAVVVIGNRKGTAGQIPKFDFLRNGEWQEINIPLSLPEFDVLYDTVFGSRTVLQNLVAFSAGTTMGTTLEMDAVFFHKRIPAAQWVPERLTLKEQEVKRLKVILPTRESYVPMTWESMDNSIATVRDGWVSGVRQGQTAVRITAGNVDTMVTITVQKKTSAYPLRGTNYYLLQLTGTAYNFLYSFNDIWRDYRPDTRPENSLALWDNTFVPMETDQENPFGDDNGWIRLAVGDKGWSGGAFSVAGSVDLRAMWEQRDKYFFHIALKSTEQTAYTLTFTDTRKTAQFVIGDAVSDDGTIPKYNFARNGQWQWLEIPLSAPEFDGMYEWPFGSVANPAALVAFSAGGVQGDELHMDAVFFYKHAPMPESITITPQAVTIRLNEVTHLQKTLLPQDSRDYSIWRSLDKEIADVRDGYVTGFSAGTARIELFLEDEIRDTCWVTVEDPAFPSLIGNHYYLMLLGNAAYDSLAIKNRIIKADLRPGKNPLSGLDIWDTTFVAGEAVGPDSYGFDEQTWLHLLVAQKTWSGGAFSLRQSADLRDIHAGRQDYYLHLALQSLTDDVYTFTLSEDNETAKFVVGDRPTDGIEPSYNFRRDGQWHELNIPLRKPEFAGLFEEVLNKPTNNILAFSAGGIPETSLKMDAVFFYKQQQLIELILDKHTLTMTEQQAFKLTVEVSPPGAFVGELRWMSTDTSVAAVHDGIVSALAPGQADIVLFYENYTDTCSVTVLQQTPPNSLIGCSYYPMLLGDIALDAIRQTPGRVVQVVDWRPNMKEENALFIWEETFGAQTIDATDCYGYSAQWPKLTVTDKEWSGGAFVTDGTIDLRELDMERENSYFHVALKSDQPVSACAFTFTDGADKKVDLVIGNTPVNGQFPIYDFKRDGRWHEIHVPFSPLFDRLFNEPRTGTEMDIMAFSAGGKQGTTLEMDALFFYKLAPPLMALSLFDLTVKEQEVAQVQRQFIPENAYAVLEWQSSDTDVATVNDGFVSGIAAGEAEIIAFYEGRLMASCRVTVTPKADRNTFIGGRFHVALLGERTMRRLDLTDRSIDHDWRPDVTPANKLEIWDNSFIADTDAVGPGCYGLGDNWLGLQVAADKEWSGAAFSVAAECDLRDVHAERNKYFFHVALKSERQETTYTLTFSDGEDEAVIVIGDRPGTDNVLPKYNFKRDGQWHEIHIPLSLPEFANLYDKVFGGAEEPVNIIAFSVGGVEATELHMDAVFFYKTVEPVRNISLPPVITVEEGSLMRAPITFQPAGAYGQMIWRSQDASVATANDNMISGLKPGTTVLMLFCNGAADTCTVEVVEKERWNSLHGSHYRLLSMGNSAVDTLMNLERIVVSDWRPGTGVADLHIWENTFTAGEATETTNSYGAMEPWVSLAVTDKGWSGGAFSVAERMDFRAVCNARDDYFFHVALKSTQAKSTYTFTFTDGERTAQVVIGNCLNEDYMMPYYDFARDGEWHEINIPLSLPEFDGMYAAPFGSTAQPVNLVVFSAGGTQGTTLDMDALFFYKRLLPPSKLSILQKNTEMSEQEVLQLTVTFEPQEAFVEEYTWRSLNPQVAAVENGFVTALQAADAPALIEVSVADCADTCWVQVKPGPWGYSLYGSDYHLLLLGTDAYLTVQDRVYADWRVGTDVQIWDGTFAAAPALGQNSYGVEEPWIALTVAGDKGWSGGAFAVKDEIDLTRAGFNRENYGFHVALKSEQPQSAYTFSFTNGTRDTAYIVVGNQKNESGLLPKYNFARDGLWHDINIPLSLPEFDGMFKTVTTATEQGVNLVAFSAGGTEGTTLDMDALFFYEMNPRVTAIHLLEEVTIVKQEVKLLEVLWHPVGAKDILTWSSSNPAVATVDDGLVTGVGVGETVITAICGTVTASCRVTVTQLSENNLRGNNYYLLFLGDSSYNDLPATERQVIRDWRPGRKAANDLQIWENTFVPIATAEGTNSYGKADPWLGLQVTDAGWSGGAFHIADEIDLRAVAAERDRFSFHIALKSTSPTVYTLGFSDGRKTTSIVIGDRPDEAGSIPSFNFARDGQWHEIEIPMTHPAFNGLYGSAFDGAQTNLMTFSAGSTAGDTLEMDAVFFFAREADPEAVVLSQQTLVMEEQQVVCLTARLTPTGAVGPPIVWQSSDERIATVTNGCISAVAAGRVHIIAASNGFSADCEVTVLPRRQSNSLEAGSYFLFLAGSSAAEELATGIVYDFRPGIGERATTSLMVWESTFYSSSTTGTNSYGAQEPWISLVVGDKGWSGAAFHVKPEYGTIDAQRIYARRDNYAFHVALKSTQPEAVFTFTFSDGKDEATVVIGPTPNTDGVLPAYNFIRDGQWQELSIPLNLPVFDALFDEPFGGMNVTNGINLLTFSAGATQGTILEMDALFFYDRDARTTAIDFLMPAVEMAQYTAWQLPLSLEPEGILPVIAWKSTNPGVAAVNAGLVSALRPGQAKIVATSHELSDTCLVTVTAIDEPSALEGDDYIVLQLGATEWESIQNTMGCDLRPDDVSRRLQIWDGTFEGATGAETGVYGTPSEWLRLSVTDKGWSGGAYTIEPSFGTIDLRRIAQNRSNYVFHIALRTEQKIAAFTFTLGDGIRTSAVVIGNQPNEAKLLPRYDIPHDGQWHEVEIPMDLPEFDGLFSAVSGGTETVNFLAFSAGGREGTILDMDAVFLYRPKIQVTGVQISSPSLTLTRQTVATLQASLLPIGSKGQITWSSSNPAIVAVNDGIVSALGVGTATVVAACDGLQANCKVTVTAAESLNSLQGSNYFVLQLGESAFEQIRDDVACNLRPNDVDRNLQVWENTFIKQTTTTATDSYGNDEPWIRMVVSDKGWSGAAYTTYGSPLDMRRLHNNRNDYLFHVALKSRQKQLAYTFTFSDGVNSAHIVIGNCPNEAGIMPQYDFVRNGAWQEINIPLTLPVFDALYAATVPSTGVNLLAFSAGGEQSTTLDMDALFFYKRPQEPKELRLSETRITLQKQSVQHITATVIPVEAYPPVRWQSSNPSVALVNEGFITAVGVGTTQIIASCADIRTVCTVTVTDLEAVNSLHGSDYSVLLMGMGAFETVTAFHPLTVDLRPDVDENRLNIWEGSFTADGGDGSENSYGHPEDWLQLKVTDKGWSGGAFSAWKKMVDWTAMKNRQNYVFHIALKGTQQKAAYTFTFTDRADTVRLVIGNHVGEQGVLPLFDFVRDGQWHEFNIPLSLPLFDKFYDARIGAVPTGSTDVMTFSAGSEQGAALNMDAVFFYRLPVYATGITLDKSAISLPLNDSIVLKATLTPADAYAGEIVWTSLQPDIATVDDKGMVRAVEEGTATIVVQSGQHSAACQVSVRRLPLIRLDKTDLSMIVGTKDVLTATWITSEIGTEPIKWASSNATTVSVDTAGKVQGLHVGEAFVRVFSGDIADTCYVSVVSPPPSLTTFLSLQGTDYYVLSLGEGPFSMIRANVLQDFRPDGVAAQFHIWENTLEAGHSAGLSSYGITEPWASLAVPEESIGWSGGAYHLTESFGEVDMTQMAESPVDFVFHIALRSRQPATYYLLTFTDTRQEAQILIGSQPVEGRLPDYDFPRDGQWHELEIPLSVLQEQGLTYDQPFFGAVNLLAFTSTGIPRTAIDMDAVFFYRKMADRIIGVSSSAFFLYPLPAQDVIHIGGLNHRTLVRIVDMQGRSVLLRETDGSIDVSTLPSGIYLLLADHQVLRFYKQ